MWQGYKFNALYYFPPILDAQILMLPKFHTLPLSMTSNLDFNNLRKMFIGQDEEYNL